MSSSQDGGVVFTSSGGVATITFDRPTKLNAFTAKMGRELIEAWKRFEQSDDQCAILTGSGERAFCAGISLDDAGVGSPEMTGMGPYLPNIGVEVTKPIIAAVNGHCIGAGWVFVQHCDLAIAGSESRFRYPEAQVGAFSGVTGSLGRAIPTKLATEFLLLGEEFDANRAAAAGMVNVVVDPAEVMPTARRWAALIASNAPLVNRGVKHFMSSAIAGPIETFAPVERMLQQILSSDERANRLSAFRNAKGQQPNK